VQSLIKTAPTSNLSPVMNRRIAGLRAQIGKPAPVPQRPPNPAKQDLAARQHRLLRTAEGGDELYKQYGYLGGFLTKLAQAPMPLIQRLAQLAAREVPPVAFKAVPRVVPAIPLSAAVRPPPIFRPLPPPSARPLKIKLSKLSRLLREFGIDLTGQPLPKQFAYMGGFLTKLAQALGQTDFEELAGLVGPGDWKAKTWADLRPGTQTALVKAVNQRMKTNPNLLRDVQTYTAGPNPYNRLFSPVRHGVYQRVQQPGFWPAAAKQFPQLVTTKE